MPENPQKNNDKVEIKCDFSGEKALAKKSPNGFRLPTGWKRIDGKVMSKKEFKKRYALRAIVVPIAFPFSPAGSGAQSKTNRTAWQVCLFG